MRLRCGDCGADDRQALEQLCRYITRPALANERVQTSAAGQVVLKLKTAWRDGTAHLVMSPLEFMQRLAALVPRPRLHSIRFLGVLAPNAKLRAQVVPQQPEPPAQATQPVECEANCAHRRPVRLSWAKLLKRVFEIDMEHCPNCGGELKIIAAILERPVIEKILNHLRLQARAPPRAPARGQALRAACRCPTVTVQATRQPGPLESAASKGLRANGNGLPMREPRKTAPERDDFRRRCQSSTVLSHLQGPTHTRRAPCSGCHGEGKGAFENPIPCCRR
ncbi:MAG: transposase [Betaproteobacteria bacterium]|nr:transposase [Betaproteobacteria bacterium]